MRTSVLHKNLMLDDQQFSHVFTLSTNTVPSSFLLLLVRHLLLIRSDALVPSSFLLLLALL